MAIESNSKNERFDVNKKFLLDFHNNVLSEKKEGKEGQKTVTMKIVSVGTAKDKHYLLPSYNPETGKVIKDREQLISKYMPLIKSGKIKSYNSPKEAEKDRSIIYPQIVGTKNGN